MDNMISEGPAGEMEKFAPTQVTRHITHRENVKHVDVGLSEPAAVDHTISQMTRKHEQMPAAKGAHPSRKMSGDKKKTLGRVVTN
jgi:hypothetical protein